MSQQKKNTVSQLESGIMLGRFCFSVRSLRQLLFTVFFLLFGLVLLCSFVLDAVMRYPLCEICILQRFVMCLLFLTSGIGLVFSRRTTIMNNVSMVVIGLLLGCGVGFSVSHVYMTYVAVNTGNEHMCQLVAELTYIPEFWHDYFYSHYTIVPCGQANATFLGLSFPMWSLLIYISATGFYAGVVFFFWCANTDRRIRKVKIGRFLYYVQYTFTIITIGLLCVWVAMSLYFITVQRQVLYKPARYPEQQMTNISSLSILDYRLSLGPQRAFLYPSDRPASRAPKYVWIMLSGRETSALDSFASALWCQFFDQFSDDADFLLVDYPGFGVNTGYPSESLNRDAVLQAYSAW